MPGFNVEEFKANLLFGVAKPNRYDVIIESPDKGISPEIGLFAEEAELPGKSFATRTMGLYGPAINFPYQEIYTNLRLTFICSDDFWERRWFEGWQRNIVNPRSGFFGYYKDYVRTLRIRQQSQLGATIYEGQALEAWPLTIDNQQLAYRSQNEYHKLTVTFAYVRFLDTDVVSGSFGSGDSGVGGNLTPSRGSNRPTPPGEAGGAPQGPQLPLPPAPTTPVAQ